MTMSRARGLAVLITAALAAACDRPPANAVTRCQSNIQTGAVATDVLFVVDDSGSMAEEQQNVHDNLALFADRVANSPIPNDVQVAVTTTSVSDFDPTVLSYPQTAGGPYYGLGYAVPYPAGTLVAVARDPATGAPINGRLDFDPAKRAFVGNRILRLGPATLAEFQANVLVGTVGTGKEQHFRAARLALTSPLVDGPNATFLRPGARLAIVFVTDEDDCSESGGDTVTTNDLCHASAVKTGTALDSVQGFADFLDGAIAGEERQPIVGVIAAIGQGASGAYAGQSCATSYDTADRFATLLNLLPADRRYAASICDASFATALQAIGDLVIPQTLPISGETDWRMLAVTVTKPDGTDRSCAVGDAPGSGVDVVYASGSPSTLSFQAGGACRLGAADRVDVRIVCAG